jgi:alanine dehydrogenase
VADAGPLVAATRDPALGRGVSTVAGQVTNEAVAEALAVPAVDPLAALGG